MIRSRYFPRLTPENHRVTSPKTTDYNCIVWADGDAEYWWQPVDYWLPADSPEDDFTLGALERVFVMLGYVNCQADGNWEIGFLKVALYGSADAYTHAARQRPDGRWTSKLGKGKDIEHDTPEDVPGGLYGQVVGFMKKAVVTPG